MSKFEGLATGDRARILMEVDVRNVGHRTLGIAGPDPYYIEAVDVVSVERIAGSLPTTPGSVLHWKNRHFYILAADGRWISAQDGSEMHASYLGNASVLFDAGASS